MARLVQWLDDWSQAFDLAAQKGAPVLLYFQVPECIGCRMMAEETFPDNSVERLIFNRFIALKMHGDSLPQSEDYGVRWTPHLIVCRTDGHSLLDSIGHQSPEQFEPWLYLGLARFYINIRQWRMAMNNLEIIISLHHKCSSAAEAIFLRGIVGYRQTGDAVHLKNAYDKLSEEYSGCAWHDRAKPYKDF